MFWDATPEPLKHFVANPEHGSIHNRGAAVDLTLYDLATGKPVQMVSGYDEFSERAYPDYPGGTSRQRYLRELLRDAMEAQGFSVYEWEWWHFNYANAERYPVLNRRFEEIGR
jgi:serine beta-lactamase-like protein LACTB